MLKFSYSIGNEYIVKFWYFSLKKTQKKVLEIIALKKILLPLQPEH